MRRGLVAIACVLLCPAIERTARADAVESLLSAYEQPPRLEDWQRLGPGTQERLMEIVLSESHRPSVRARAVSSLAAFPSRQTREFLETLLAGKDVASILRRKAALALVVAFGQGAVPALEPQLADADERLRDVVARALGRAGGTRAWSALERQRAVESSPLVQRTMDAALDVRQP